MGCETGQDDLCYRELEKIDRRHNHNLARQELMAFDNDYHPTARYVKMYQQLLAAELNNEKLPYRNQAVARQLVTYYEGERDREKLIRSYIIAGSIYANSSDGPKAIECYHKAENLLGEKGKLDVKAKLYQCMADLLVHHNMIDEAQKYANRAGYSYQELRDTLGMINAHRVLGECSRRSRQPDKEIINLKEAQRLAQLSGMVKLGQSLSLNLLHAKYRAQSYKEALRSALPLINTLPKIDAHSLYALLSQVYYALGQKDSAFYYGQKVMDDGNSVSKRDAHKVLANLCIERGDRIAAEEHLNAYIDLNDELNRIENSDAIAQADAFYHNQKQAEENAQLRNANQQKQIWIIFIVAFLIVLLVLFATYIQRHRRRQELMALRIQQLEEYRLSYEKTNKDEIIHTEQSIRQTPIFQRLAMMDESDHPTDEDWQSLSDAINQTYPQFSSRLFSLCSLSPHEYRVCLLLKAGFEPVRISILTFRSKAAISVVRSRLYEKAFGKKGSAKDWDEVIKTL
ncbi:MAG: hypothetical protein IJ647_04005 [Prevotella sp.]|nr:hypothetical protein [Prevotella sp.]